MAVQELGTPVGYTSGGMVNSGVDTAIRVSCRLAGLLAVVRVRSFGFTFLVQGSPSSLTDEEDDLPC